LEGEIINTFAVATHWIITFGEVKYWNSEQGDTTFCSYKGLKRRFELISQKTPF